MADRSRASERLGINIRPLYKEDESAVLALNAAHELETAPLSRDGLHRLLAEAFRCRIVGADMAFYISLDQDTRSDSPNVRWFKARYPRFVYMDRIIVAPFARGRGIARALYADLAGAAREAGHCVLCAEVNVDPPNPQSLALHRSIGFEQLAIGLLADRGKTVCYLSLAL